VIKKITLQKDYFVFYKLYLFINYQLDMQNGIINFLFVLVLNCYTSNKFNIIYIYSIQYSISILL